MGSGIVDKLGEPRRDRGELWGRGISHRWANLREDSVQGLPREKGREPGLARGTAEAAAPRSQGMRPRQSSGFRVLSLGDVPGGVTGYSLPQHLAVCLSLQAKDRARALRGGREVSLPPGTALGAGPGPPGAGVIPEGGQPGAGAGEWPRARERVSLAAPGAPRLAWGPPAAGQRRAPQGTRYSPGPGRPAARGLPAGSPAPAPVGGSRTRAQVGGGGLIALTQDGSGGFAASHVIIGMLKRAPPCPWRAGSGPGLLALRCWLSHRFLSRNAATSGKGRSASLKHPQKTSRHGAARHTAMPTTNMSAAASLGGRGALAGGRPAVARRGGGARAAYRENGVRRRRWPWRTGPVATGTLRGRWWAKRRVRRRHRERAGGRASRGAL